MRENILKTHNNTAINDEHNVLAGSNPAFAANTNKQNKTMKNLTRLYAILAIAFATVLCYLVVDLYFNLSLPNHYLSFAIVCTAGFYASLAMYFFSKKNSLK